VATRSNVLGRRRARSGTGLGLRWRWSAAFGFEKKREKIGVNVFVEVEFFCIWRPHLHFGFGIRANDGNIVRASVFPADEHDRFGIFSFGLVLDFAEYAEVKRRFVDNDKFITSAGRNLVLGRLLEPVAGRMVELDFI